VPSNISLESPGDARPRDHPIFNEELEHAVPWLRIRSISDLRESEAYKVAEAEVELSISRKRLVRSPAVEAIIWTHFGCIIKGVQKQIQKIEEQWQYLSTVPKRHIDAKAKPLWEHIDILHDLLSQLSTPADSPSFRCLLQNPAIKTAIDEVRRLIYP
jgi:hypothetical protein